MTVKEYTLNDLIKSTAARARYNLDLAARANRESERERFLSNANKMMRQIEWAIEDGNPDYLTENRDW